MKAILLALTLMSLGTVAAGMWNHFPKHSSTSETNDRNLGRHELSQGSGICLRQQSGISNESLAELMTNLKLSNGELQQMNSYTCTLKLQESIDGELRDPEEVELKIQQSPFSVYMRWPASGQEAMFVEGKHDNKLLVRPSGGFAALKRVWKMDPESRIAMKSSRYPVTDSGLQNLTTRVLTFYDALPTHEGIDCQCRHIRLDGRIFREYRVRFPSKAISPEYSSSRYLIDQERLWLTAVENFGWDDDAHPIESYSYCNIVPMMIADPSTFDPSNPDYGFAAR